MWSVERYERETGAPLILLIVHSDDRKDDRVLELDPADAIDVAVELLCFATGRDPY